MPAVSDDEIVRLAVHRGLIGQAVANRLLALLTGPTPSSAEALLVGGGLIDAATFAILKGEAARGEVPPVVPGFRIIAKLGDGGMGVVYRALQISLDRPVALKVLHPHLARDQEFVGRFLNEARSAARIDHPNVVACHNVGEAEDRYFIAMEFVPGGDADHLAVRNGGRLTAQRTLEVMRDCARGLEAVRKAGLVHRDIKSTNIFIGADGQAKLGDLGLAHDRGSKLHLTTTGAAMGTPAFMSPEQADGARDLDVRSDIYSLCATAYHLVSGRLPFEGNTSWAVAAQVIAGPFPDPRTAAPDLPPAFVAILVKGTARDRGRRYQAPENLREDCELALRGEPLRYATLAPARSARSRALLTPVASGRRAQIRPRRRSRNLTLVMILLVVAAAAGGAGGAWFLLRAPSPTRAPDPVQPPPEADPLPAQPSMAATSPGPAAVAAPRGGDAATAAAPATAAARSASRPVPGATRPEAEAWRSVPLADPGFQLSSTGSLSAAWRLGRRGPATSRWSIARTGIEGSLRIELDEPAAESACSVRQIIPVSQGWKEVRLRLRAHVGNLGPTKNPMGGAMATLEFFNADGERDLRSLRLLPSWGWSDWATEAVAVPVGLDQLAVGVALQYCTGKADFDDFVLEWRP